MQSIFLHKRLHMLDLLWKMLVEYIRLLIKIPSELMKFYANMGHLIRPINWQNIREVIL